MKQNLQQSEDSLLTIYMAVNEEDLEILDTQIPYFMEVSKDAMKYCPESVRDDIMKIRTNIKNEYIKIQKLEENYMRVKIKSWNEMLEICDENEFAASVLYYYEDEIEDECRFTIGMEHALPEDRIIELDGRDMWQEWGFSDWMVAEYLDKLIETESKTITPQNVVAEYIADINILVDLDSPDHPANQPLLPELDEFKGIEAAKDVLELLDTEFNLKQVKSDNFKVLKSLRKSASRTHYYKFSLNFSEDYSIRYFIIFEDRKEYEGQFVLKSHSKRESSIITRAMAEDLIGKLCEIPCEEIIGRRCGKNYEKIIISENKLVRFTE